MFGYLFAFGCGLAGGPWLVNGEIYPTRVRGVANAAAATSNWLANYVVAETFLSVVKLAGASATFLALGAVCALGGLWLWRALPETAGCTIEQIEAIFRPSAAPRRMRSRSPHAADADGPALLYDEPLTAQGEDGDEPGGGGIQ